MSCGAPGPSLVSRQNRRVLPTPTAARLEPARDHSQRLLRKLIGCSDLYEFVQICTARCLLGSIPVSSLSESVHICTPKSVPESVLAMIWHDRRQCPIHSRPGERRPAQYLVLTISNSSLGARLPIFLPQPPAILDVETERLAPLDARGCRWPHRPVLLNEKPGGPRRRPGLRPALMPRPSAAAGPRPPRSTVSSGNTCRRMSPWPMSPILWARAYRITWRESSEATSDAASWPTASPGPDAQAAATTETRPPPRKG